MKKLTILVTLIAVLAGSLFAADTYESGILFHTNTYVDDADGYVATERSVSLDYLSSTGEVLASTEAEAFYSPRSNGSVDRTIVGDAEVFDLLDLIGDGYVMTPFNDAVHSYEYDELEPTSVDGVACRVFTFSVALDRSAFTAGAKESGLIGWDSDAKDENGDVMMTVYVDSESGAIVRQEATIDFGDGLSVSQSADFDLIGGVNLPTSVVTSGTLIDSSAPGVQRNVTRFQAHESLGSYVATDDWHDA